jgi:hypothetical protein
MTGARSQHLPAGIAKEHRGLNPLSSTNHSLERRKALGETGPEPIPHPDDVHIDVRTGQVGFTGPLTKEEKAQWDRLYDLVEKTDRIIELMASVLKRTRSKIRRAKLEEGIVEQRSFRDKIVRVVGEPSERRRK